VRTSEFIYHLPDRAIAQHPVEPRDAARLLAVPGLSDHRFSDLPRLLEPGDVVVVNDTRVRAARLRGRKAGSGGEVEILLLGRGADGAWDALVRPARRLREGSEVEVGRLRVVLVGDPVDGLARVRLEDEGGGGDQEAVEEAIEREGTVPLPPYITRPLDDPARYQTVYASVPGSSAAPTAGLHVTPGVLAGLARRGIEVATIELRVGLDTFRPITTERVEDHRIHSEWVSVPPDTVRAVETARGRGGAVVAVGTTVVRALESWAGDGELTAGEGSTELFITPGYRFRVVDRLITNFHLPGSTLVCLVAAFAGPVWRPAYETALERGYRFLSFGDAMLADRAAS
jgi:S-adenosylmethionine:tRNA ribosyltransferase-isomerase